MADIVAMASYRAAYERLQSRRRSDLLAKTGPATLLLFTGVRREPIGGKAPSGAKGKDRSARRRAKAPATDH
ncbi:hypothetical protein [Oceaniradius stylonematis]|jgi:hypothetical protein|uniref:hypothetical protein n=1 Tax=Oceaniradius stylonematis TaxID=2184161 RepID=UPI0035D05BF9